MEAVISARQRAHSDLIKAFVNSVYDEQRQDRFATVAGAGAWLAAHGLLDADVPVTETERERLVRVREAVRALLLANNGADLDPAQSAVLNEAAARTPWQGRFDGTALAGLTATGAGVDAAISSLLARVAVLMLDGTWPHLKVCRADTCHFAYFDRTRNQSRVWCSMDGCGSREKSKAYQRRRRIAARAVSGPAVQQGD